MQHTTLPGLYTLSLHDALPISKRLRVKSETRRGEPAGSAFSVGSTTTRTAATARKAQRSRVRIDRKSTRLNSSHQIISYAVFCLKKKNNRCALGQPQQHVHQHP